MIRISRETAEMPPTIGEMGGNFRPPDLAAQNGRIDEIRMIPNVVKHPNRNSPPKLGGEAVRAIKTREHTLFRADGRALASVTTPTRLMNRCRAAATNYRCELL